jgi:hypothetical protein
MVHQLVKKFSVNKNVEPLSILFKKNTVHLSQVYSLTFTLILYYHLPLGLLS